MGEKINNFSDIRRADTRCTIGCKYKWELKKTECRFIFRKIFCENEWNCAGAGITRRIK
jgi:hypothetical protein